VLSARLLCNNILAPHRKQSAELSASSYLLASLRVTSFFLRKSVIRIWQLAARIVSRGKRSEKYLTAPRHAFAPYLRPHLQDSKVRARHLLGCVEAVESDASSPATYAACRTPVAAVESATSGSR
jgi:hypothetical protein